MQVYEIMWIFSVAAVIKGACCTYMCYTLGRLAPQGRLPSFAMPRLPVRRRDLSEWSQG